MLIAEASAPHCVRRGSEQLRGALASVEVRAWSDDDSVGAWLAQGADILDGGAK